MIINPCKKNGIEKTMFDPNIMDDHEILQATSKYDDITSQKKKEPKIQILA